MRRENNLRDLMTHSGEFFEHWRRRCLASFGVGLEEAGDGG